MPTSGDKKKELGTELVIDHIKHSARDKMNEVTVKLDTTEQKITDQTSYEENDVMIQRVMNVNDKQSEIIFLTSYNNQGS